MLRIHDDKPGYLIVFTLEFCCFCSDGNREAETQEWSLKVGGQLRKYQPGRPIMDPSTCPTRSLISTNQRREMLLFLSRIFFVSHAGITNNGLAHTDSVRFCRFWFNRPTAKWLYGCLQGNRLRTISSSNLYRHH